MIGQLGRLPNSSSSKDARVRFVEVRFAMAMVPSVLEPEADGTGGSAGVGFLDLDAHGKDKKWSTRSASSVLVTRFS
jgi:hypothetical protein